MLLFCCIFIHFIEPIFNLIINIFKYIAICSYIFWVDQFLPAMNITSKFVFVNFSCVLCICVSDCKYITASANKFPHPPEKRVWRMLLVKSRINLIWINPLFLVSKNTFCFSSVVFVICIKTRVLHWTLGHTKQTNKNKRIHQNFTVWRDLPFIKK